MDCEITTDIDHEQLRGGDSITANIVLQIDRSVRYRNITAKFLGAEKAKVEVQDSKREGNSTETITRTNRIVEEAYLLAGEEPRGFIGEWIDSIRTMFGGGAAATLDSGEHRFSVTLTIPEHALPTHKGRYSEVFYRLSIRLDQPLKMDSVFDIDLTVVPERSRSLGSVTAYYPDEDTGTIQRTLSRDIRAIATLEERLLHSGDIVRGSLQIEADEPLHCKGISVCLLSEERVEIRRDRELHRSREDSFEVLAATEIVSQWQGDFSFPVEAIKFSSAKGEYFSLDWFVEIKIDLPWAKDCAIRVPVTVNRTAG